MLKEFQKAYDDALNKTKQRANQGIVDTYLRLHERSLYYIDESAYR